jgi:hypothetical protein
LKKNWIILQISDLTEENIKKSEGSSKIGQCLTLAMCAHIFGRINFAILMTFINITTNWFQIIDD